MGLSSYALILFAIAASASVASAAVVQPRAYRSQCEYATYGDLAVYPKGGDNTDLTFVSFVSGVTHAGIDGQQASILITKDDSGDAVKPTYFDFYRCSDENGPPPSNDGYPQPPNSNGDETAFFGQIVPHGAHKHCLALESKQDGNKGDRNSLVDSSCQNIPNAFKTWYLHTFSYYTYDYITFAHETMKVYVSDTKHGEIVLINDYSFRGKQEMQLVMIKRN